MLLVRASLVAVLALVVLMACGNPSSPASAETHAAPQAPAPAHTPTATSPVPDAGTVSGTVAETMSSGGYTYARLTNDGKDTWMAAPEMLSVTVGDRLVGTVSMPMEQFRSRTLNREFDVIYFVNRVTRNGEVLEPVAAASGRMAEAGSHAAGSDGDPASAAPMEPVDPAPGGVRVSDVWARREVLAGTTVLVRGRVVKANYEIMGVNWYHLQDGSGVDKDGTNDLTITSDAQARVGDVVTIAGTLVINKDFGAGYAYETLVEKASIRK